MLTLTLRVNYDKNSNNIAFIFEIIENMSAFWQFPATFPKISTSPPLPHPCIRDWRVLLQQSGTYVRVMLNVIVHCK